MPETVEIVAENGDVWRVRESATFRTSAPNRPSTIIEVQRGITTIAWLSIPDDVRARIAAALAKEAP